MKKTMLMQALITIKKLVVNDKNGESFSILINRYKNKEFIREQGLYTEDIKRIILDLEYSDYYKGPENDKNSECEGFIWFFSPKFEDLKLYIKIRIESKKRAICISIHEFGLYEEEVK